MNDKNNNTVDLTRLRLLIDAGGTREQIANVLNCDTSTITKHYNGDRKVSIDFLVKYAKYFNVSTDYLLGISDAATNSKDIQFICDYTGLNVESISTLNKLCSNSDCDKYFLNKFVDYIYNSRFYIPNYVLHRKLLISAYKKNKFDFILQDNVERCLFVSQYQLQFLFNRFLNDRELAEAIEWYNNNKTEELVLDEEYARAAKKEEKNLMKFYDIMLSEDRTNIGEFFSYYYSDNDNDIKDWLEKNNLLSTQSFIKRIKDIVGEEESNLQELIEIMISKGYTNMKNFFSDHNLDNDNDIKDWLEKNNLLSTQSFINFIKDFEDVDY